MQGAKLGPKILGSTILPPGPKVLGSTILPPGPKALGSTILPPDPKVLGSTILLLPSSLLLFPAADQPSEVPAQP